VPDRRKLVFTVVLLATCTLVVEAGLQVFARVSPRVNVMLSSPWDPKISSPTIPDPRLGYRPNPAHLEHDEYGFRNPRVPGDVDIVALGDSQTYGTGVAAEHAWPRQLESLSGRSVYSMACGGYGPGHSLLLWAEAVAKKPEIVVEALYSGNDFYDAFRLVYVEHQLPEVRNPDEARLAAVMQAEESEPLTTYIRRMFSMGAPLDAPTPVPQADGSVRGWLSEHSRLFGLVRRTRYEVTRPREEAEVHPDRLWQQAVAFADVNAEYCEVFSSERSRTVLTPEYRLAALDPDDPRIREGQRVAAEAIIRMKQLSVRDGVRFVVLLIPTKELVFSEQAAALRSRSYHELVRKERQLWAEVRAVLDDHGIEWVDAMPSLQAGLAAGQQPYQVTWDGHPAEAGHRVIAETLVAYLRASATTRDGARE
jgi:lysophospholipase L1-like esterase